MHHKYEMPDAAFHQRSYPAWLIPVLSGGLLLVVILLLVILTSTGFSFFKKNSANSFVNKNGTVSISGKLGLNGVPPSGSTVSVGVKESGKSSYTTVITDLAADDGAVWSWNGAKDGIAYDVQAYLISNGKTIATSSTLSVVAPADEEVLSLTAPATKNPNAPPASISGVFNLNGYIPANSTITISSRPQGSGNFNTIQSGLAAVDGASWSWTTAKQNTAYELQATLVAFGSNATQSQVIQVTAPATGETLTINSTLTPPAPQTVSLSGTFNVNGSVPSGATISLGVRQTGTSQFNIVSTGLSTNSGTSWSWGNAQAGTSYDMQAYVMNNGNNISSSQILTAAAPASGETLTLNVQTQPTTPPNNSLNYTCVGKNPASGLWQVQISYNLNTVITNAQQYLLTIGNTSGGNQFVNNTIQPASPKQSQSYTTNYVFVEGSTYYAQWAYSTCQNCSTFSNFTQALSFTCVTQPATPTPTPTPTPTSTPTPTPSPTPSPTPTPTPTTVPTPTPTDDSNSTNH